MNIDGIIFHSKARNGREKVKISDQPSVMVSKYKNAHAPVDDIAMTFYNGSGIYKQYQYCTVGFVDNRVYFIFDDNSLTGYKISANKSNPTIKFNDDRFMQFVNIRPYMLHYDKDRELWYIEKSPVKNIINKV